jgi:hypothetical protein
MVYYSDYRDKPTSVNVTVGHEETDLSVHITIFHFKHDQI